MFTWALLPGSPDRCRAAQVCGEMSAPVLPHWAWDPAPAPPPWTQDMVPVRRETPTLGTAPIHPPWTLDMVPVHQASAQGEGFASATDQPLGSVKGQRGLAGVALVPDSDGSLAMAAVRKNTSGTCHCLELPSSECILSWF